MSISYKTPASFSNFSCLGSECEDTCCRNWEIKLDRQHFGLLKKAMQDDEHDKNIFEQYIRLNNNSIAGDHDYAFIHMAENGYCAMLDQKGLCSVHAKHGITVLGDVCTMFPRVISRCGSTVELSGALSCPQVVRECINDSTPLKVKRFKTSDLPRSKNYPIQRELSLLDDDYYSENFSYIREKVMALMAVEEQALETRLYSMVNLAYKLSDFYHRGCKKPAAGQLESVCSMFFDKDFVMKMDAYIKDYDAGSPVSMIVVHSVLMIKLQQVENENISLLYKNIIQHYSHNNNNVSDILAEQLGIILNKLEHEKKEYIDKAITRYILNCLYREWFVSMPDLFTYVQMLLVRVSILRSLIYLELGRHTEMDMSELKQKVVYVMYNFARNIDQNLEFLKVVYNALSEQTMMNFDFSPAFIRIS